MKPDVFRNPLADYILSGHAYLHVPTTEKTRFIAEIYGIYLPTHAERVEIFRIHLGLKQRDPDTFDLEALAGATDGYTGADVKEVVLMGLKFAFHAGQKLSTEHRLQAVPEIRPLYSKRASRLSARRTEFSGGTAPLATSRVASQSDRRLRRALRDAEIVRFRFSSRKVAPEEAVAPVNCPRTSDFRAARASGYPRPQAEPGPIHRLFRMRPHFMLAFASRYCLY